MQFKVGDFVVHPVYGVGDIVRIEEKRFSDTGARFYYEIALPRSTIWIPVDAQETVGLRLVTARSDLGQYRDVLKSPPVPLNKDQSQRNVELANRLKQGSFPEMCEVVRDLTASNWRKPLASVDKATLRKTRERLSQEWAAADGISVTEATKEINALLRASRQKSLE
jgi:CarD family transcriptional regulator